MSEFHKITAHVCSWKSPELLRVFIPRFLGSITEDVNLKIVLNEADAESIDVCRDYKVDFIAIDKNYGTLAVDFLIPFTKSEYILQSNTDMYFPKGWDTAMLFAAENNGNCSISLSLIEPGNSCFPVVIADNLGSFTDKDTYDRFFSNFKFGKYKLSHKTYYTHPILAKTKDVLKIGGYSNNLDMRYFPGYSLDISFPYRLYKLYDWNFRCITLGNWFVYHGVSMVNNKLDPATKARNGYAVFEQESGMTRTQFEQKIGAFQEINVNE